MDNSTRKEGAARLSVADVHPYQHEEWVEISVQATSGVRSSVLEETNLAKRLRMHG